MKTAYAAWLALALCSCATVAPVQEMAPPEKPTEHGAPLFPFWPIAVAEDISYAKDMPEPTGAAALVAPGYLLAPMAGMGDAAADFGMDPTVYLGVGSRIVQGKFVDVDATLEMGVIRADIPFAPFRLSAPDAAPNVLLRFAQPSLRREAVPMQGEQRRKDLPYATITQADGAVAIRSCKAFGFGLPGAAMLAPDGSLAGFQVTVADNGIVGGPEASAIRSYLEVFFASWGKYGPKPAF